MPLIQIISHEIIFDYNLERNGIGIPEGDHIHTQLATQKLNYLSCVSTVQILIFKGLQSLFCQSITN
jgi:hypothetical protein